MQQRKSPHLTFPIIISLFESRYIVFILSHDLFSMRTYLHLFFSNINFYFSGVANFNSNTDV